ncbi:helix-turn-helix protein [Aneurinibacillus soli]|uniref:Helix-turn-helix conjugative transposon-like domain-containing protein n=1 Tax=Aneurinibacillus soli TaxID=1500254 RepID=A0A0U5BDV0_9BACL|nr:helix-turn-helix domain-containing protein [Aneurinibacillus soli]PYE61983.1 helix-turn-helix protein [Aneurinibacillus soli]BAU29798.1 hypothetical protein CB4_04035 [Aneurinibacillus soli]
MQKKVVKEFTEGSASFSSILEEARCGNNESLIYILNFFDDYIHELTKFIKAPKEEVVQEIQVRFIEEIRKNGYKK